MIKVIYPERINLRYWSSCLVADYFNENLPKLENPDENSDDWRKWGAQIAETGIFLASSVPSPIAKGSNVRFKTWQEWAKAVYIVMSNEFNK